jgi:hypothetical protein
MFLPCVFPEPTCPYPYLCPDYFSAYRVLEIFLEPNIMRFLGQVSDEELKSDQRHEEEIRRG